MIPKQVIEKKRFLDKEFNVYSHIFKNNIIKKYNSFIHNCFETFTGWGNDAKIKMNLTKRIDLPEWKSEWNELFVEEKMESQEKFDNSYHSIHSRIFKVKSIELSAFFKLTSEKLQKVLEVDINEGKHYNIFEILKIQSLEARVHSPFIVNLLNPKGSHKMGTLFLDHFLLKVGLVHSFEEAKNWILEAIVDELALPDGKGRADIFMQFNVMGEFKAIIIENKIYAGDQQNQLERYSQYLMEDLNLSLENFYIFYLTLDGKAPSEHSITKEKLIGLNYSFKQISYSEQVTNWLADCSKESIPDNIKHSTNYPHLFLKTF